MSVRLFIGNLPYTATEAELRDHLSSVGEPAQIVLPTDRETGRPRGFAFVDYADRAVAEEAIRQFNQQPFKGRPLAVSEARPREDRPAGPRPGGFSGPRPAAGQVAEVSAARARAASVHRDLAGLPARDHPIRTFLRRGAVTSGPMLHPRTSASPRARTPTAVRAAPSRNVRSDACTTPTKIGVLQTRRSSRSITSPARTPTQARTTATWATTRAEVGQGEQSFCMTL